MSNPCQTSSIPFEDEVGDRYRKQNCQDDELSHEERLQKTMQEIEDSENRQLESTINALRSIDDSERIGGATAEALLHQSEHFKYFEQRAGKISQDLKTSQKHITNIKSIFGGIKNWWYGDKDKEPPARPSEAGSSRLQPELDKTAASRPHANERNRVDDGRASYKENDLDDNTKKGSQHPEDQKEERVNQHQDTLTDGIARLKTLAQSLADEIESQNEQLGHIDASAGRADIKLQDQNKHMRDILN